MIAIGYTGKNGSDKLIQFQQETPIAKGSDVLVNIKAVSVNPVDVKLKKNTSDKQDPPRILGFDAAGIVESIGEDVSLFDVGDKVFYAGDVTRAGSYASHQIVDERIIAKMPSNLSFVEAAALPLTGITAWESLFDRLAIPLDDNKSDSILIIGGAGGVGSIAIQLVKQLTNLTIVTTASRDETRDWCFKLGADHVINHHQDMVAQYQQLAIEPPKAIFCLTKTAHHSDAMAEIIAPQGMICAIDDVITEAALNALKPKSVGFVWEFMFTRSMFKTGDMVKQHQILTHIAKLVDAGEIQSTQNQSAKAMTVENINQAHAVIASGKSIGKIVLENIFEES